MLIAITRLQFKEAFYYNRLFFVLLPLIFILFMDFIVGYLFQKEYKIITKIPIGVYITIAVIILLFGVLRNTETFNYLRPIFID